MLTQRLRHRITIQKPIYSQNAETGGITTAWQDVYADMAAECLTGAGREFIESQTMQAPTDARINFRWVPDLDQSYRIVWDGDYYNILGMETDRTSRREWRTRCQKGVVTYQDAAPPVQLAVTVGGEAVTVDGEEVTV